VYPLLAELAGYGEPGSDRWCTVQVWAGFAAVFSSDPAGALRYFTALRDAVADWPLSRALADALAGRARALLDLGQVPEAAEDARRALAVAREVGHPDAEVIALVALASAAAASGDASEAVRLARQADQVPGDIVPSTARSCRMALTDNLIEIGDFAAAKPVCAAALAACRDAGDLRNLPEALYRMARLDLRAGHTGDAAAHLREAIQLALRTGTWNPDDHLDACGHLCAATGRPAEAVTAWAAYAALLPGGDWPGHARRREEPLRAAWRALGPEQTRAAEERGAAMSWATAAEYALLLTEDPGRPPAVPPGLGELSARERELVALVAQGATNAQIAARLHISGRTVSSHLDRIRDKTGARRRADLTRLALAEGLV